MHQCGFPHRVAHAFRRASEFYLTSSALAAEVIELLLTRNRCFSYCNRLHEPALTSDAIPYPGSPGLSFASVSWKPCC
jgi:hypothetical protein